MTTILLFDTTTAARTSSTWSRPSPYEKWYDFEPKLYRLLRKSAALRFLFCISSEFIEELDLDDRVKDAVRREMTMSRPGVRYEGIHATTRAVYDLTGYDLANHRRKAMGEELRRQMDAEAAEEERLAEQQGVLGNPHLAQGNEPEEPIRPDAMVVYQAPKAPADAQTPVQGTPGVVCMREHAEHEEDVVAKVIPRFVASIVRCLHSKFPSLVATEANRLLISKEYSRVCRETDIRSADALMHYQWVMNAYFNEGIHSQVPSSRARAPHWLRKAFATPAKASDVLC